MHPLLAGAGGDTANTYVEVPHQMGSSSLLASPPADESASQAEAVFVVEAFLQVDTPKGLQAASNFVSVMSRYPSSMKVGRGSIPIAVSYRIVPSTTATNHPLCPIFANAGILGATTFKTLIDAAIQHLDFETIEALVDQIPDLDGDVKSQVTSLANEECSPAWQDWVAPANNFVVANGRFYALDNSPSLQRDDIDLLLSLDVARNKAVTKLVNVHLDNQSENYNDAIARIATFLALEQTSQSKRSDLVGAVQEAWKTAGEKQNPLMFSWNTDENVDELVVSLLFVWYESPINN
jgi:hypothetical protein